MAARLILDTNVALDLLLFSDASCAALARGLADGSAVWLVSPACRSEFLRVTGYPSITRFCARHDDDRRAAAVAGFDRLGTPTAATAAGPLPSLPRCADPDDQRLFVFAATTAADALLSRDKAVLAMARRLRTVLPRLRVCRPEEWPQPEA